MSDPRAQLKKGYADLVAEASNQITTLSVEEAAHLLGRLDTVFVDLRETPELEQEGVIPGALHVPRGLLEFLIDPESPWYDPALSDITNPARQVVLYCAIGGRSALAAQQLQAMGLERVAHLGGGMVAWKEAQQPTEEYTPPTE
jgi:rhodanese-related sulfurtransferase